MPLYDRSCTVCDWTEIDVWEPVRAEAPPCPECQSPTVRAWLTKQRPTVIGDEMDHWQKNGTKVPIHFTSKAARRRWMKKEGLREVDTHIGVQGSDKSKFTRSWDTFDPQTAENKRILMERAFGQSGDDEEPVDPAAVQAIFKTEERLGRKI